jgi:hypothetical protein
MSNWGIAENGTQRLQCDEMAGDVLRIRSGEKLWKIRERMWSVRIISKLELFRNLGDAISTLLHIL